MGESGESVVPHFDWTKMADEGEKRRFDWRTIGMMAVMLVGQGIAQWAIITTQINELTRRVEKIEQKLDEKMMPRQEFEMRHQDLERRVEELRERVQQLEIKK